MSRKSQIPLTAPHSATPAAFARLSSQSFHRTEQTSGAITPRKEAELTNYCHSRGWTIEGIYATEVSAAECRSPHV